MNYLIKNERLKLKYEPGKGAWTYHIEIPNTGHIIGKWGSLKVSGFIDNYELKSKNLFTIKKGQDKWISINEEIRKSINKSGGDTVTVTLYLLAAEEKLTEKKILEIFRESGVLNRFKNLDEDEKAEILQTILSQKSDEKKIKIIVKEIDKLSIQK